MEKYEAETYVKNGIMSELETTVDYDNWVLRLKELYENTGDEKYLNAAKVIEDISKEELTHAGEFSQVLSSLDPENAEAVQEGMEEAEGIKMNDSVKYTLFGDVFEPDENGMKVNGKYFTKDKLEEIYQKYKGINIFNRPSAILFYQAYFKKTYPMNNFKKIGDAYKANDSVKDGKYIIQHKDNPNSTVGEDGLFHFGGVKGAKRYNTRQEAEEHAYAMSSDWKDLYNIVEVKDSNIGDNCIKDATKKDIESVMNNYVARDFLVKKVTKLSPLKYQVDYDDDYNSRSIITFDDKWDEWVYTINGHGPISHSSEEWLRSDLQKYSKKMTKHDSDEEFKEANVNEPLNPMCDSEDMVDDIMGEQLEMQQLKDVNTKLSKNTLKDSDTSNDIGLYSVGCKYRWEDKYGNTILSLTDICPTGEIKLNLDKNVFILLPMEKFEAMLRSGDIKETDTLNIEKYDRVDTKKNFKVKFGDRTFIVKAKDSVEAVEKVKELEDDRLSPMTYKKLKELGYSNKQWSNWTQEQANEMIAKRENRTSNRNSSKTAESSAKPVRLSPKKYEDLSDIMADEDEIWNNLAKNGVDKTFEEYEDLISETYLDNTGKTVSSEEIKEALKKFYKEMEKSGYFEE